MSCPSSVEQVQLQRIDKLNSEIAFANRIIREKNQKIEELQQYQDFWHSLYAAMKESEPVKDQFFQLMVTLKLCTKQKIPGWTHEFRREPEQPDLFSFDPMIGPYND